MMISANEGSFVETPDGRSISECNASGRATGTVGEGKKDTFGCFSESSIVRLNVGGTIFDTTMTTLSSFVPHFLHSLITSESQQHETRIEYEYGPAKAPYFIDRDPALFPSILNFLRKGKINLPRDPVVLADLLDEAKFYGIEPLVCLIEKHRLAPTSSPLENGHPCKSVFQNIFLTKREPSNGSPKILTGSVLTRGFQPSFCNFAEPVCDGALSPPSPTANTGIRPLSRSQSRGNPREVKHSVKLTNVAQQKAEPLNCLNSKIPRTENLDAVSVAGATVLFDGRSEAGLPIPVRIAPNEFNAPSGPTTPPTRPATGTAVPPCTASWCEEDMAASRSSLMNDAPSPPNSYGRKYNLGPCILGLDQEDF